jgi:hypothetical protein
VDKIREVIEECKQVSQSIQIFEILTHVPLYQQLMARVRKIYDLDPNMTDRDVISFARTENEKKRLRRLDIIRSTNTTLLRSSSGGKKKRISKRNPKRISKFKIKKVSRRCIK